MFYRFCICLMFCGFLAGTARGETIHLTDGQTFSGEIVSLDDKGIILKQADGQYSDRIAWGKISQADLKELDQNPKAAQFVEPFIELTIEDKVKRTEIEIKDFPRLQRPAAHSLIGALFSSSVGILIILLAYGANLYAAYEISVFRAHPMGLVCGVSAVAPFIGPIIFLSLPPRLRAKEPEWQPPAEETTTVPAPAEPAAGEQVHAAAQAEIQAEAPPAAAKPVLPAGKTFLRGQFTFNRRFFETQVPGFFAVTRPVADQDMVLLFKAVRGTYSASRISRITAAEIQLQVQKGGASEDVVIPFVEIQEVQLKHKDA